MKRLNLQPFVLLASAGILIADDRSAPPPIKADTGLPELIEYAALNNAGLKSAYQQWQAALLKIPQVRALPDPKLSYGYFLRSVETRVGPQNHKVGIAQVFPWFGKLELRGERAAREAEIAFQLLEAKRQQLSFVIRDGYHEYAYLHRAIQIVEENISQLKQLEGVAQVKFKGGGTYLGVIKAQVELGKLTDRKATLVDLLDPTRARLNASLSRDSDAFLPKPKVTPAPALETDEAKLLAHLADFNPNLKGIAAGIAREAKSVEIAKKNFYPDVTLGVDYIQTGDAIAAGTAGNSKDPIVAMFSINIPLWRNKLRAGVKEAEAREQAAIARRVDVNHQLAANLKFALFGYRDAERKISLYRGNLVPQAKSALTIALKSYENGNADFLETVDAQRLLFEFQLQAERSAADREQRLAEIDLILGTKDQP
jgi:outer membrane protein, heavy metal efflux system